MKGKVLKKPLLIISVILTLILFTTSCKSPNLPPTPPATPPTTSTPISPSPTPHQIENKPSLPIKAILEQHVITAQGASISSNDGRLTLDIPPGALPQDTTVTASVVPEDNWASDVNLLEPLQVLKLDAGGLEFKEPVTVTIRLEAEVLKNRGLPTGTYPACLIFTKGDDGMWDVLGNPTTEVNAGTGEIVVTGKASHFSAAVVHTADIASLIYPTSEEKFVGETWTPTVTAYNFSDDFSFDIAPISYSGRYSVGNIGPDKAAEFTLGPGENRVLDPPPIFECDSDGDGYYEANILAWITFDYWQAFKFTFETQKFPESLRLDVRGEAQCKVPLITPTPTTPPNTLNPPTPTTPPNTLNPPTPTTTANITGEIEESTIEVVLQGAEIRSRYLFEDNLPILYQILDLNLVINDLTGGANPIVDGGWVIVNPDSVVDYLEMDWEAVLSGSSDDNKSSGPLDVQPDSVFDMFFEVDLNSLYLTPGTDFGLIMYGINSAGQQRSAAETITVPEPPPPPEPVDVLFVSFEAAVECQDEISCTLTISFDAVDLTGGDMPVTGVVLTVNGVVWGDSGAINLTDYNGELSQTVASGNTFNIEITAYNGIGLMATAADSITLNQISE
ncbi:hypothetical protein ACFLWN_02390 [Chloroflexota bacterium]